MKTPPTIIDGDLIGLSEKGWRHWVEQVCGCTVPNIGPAGAWGIAGFSGVGIMSHGLVYESTFDPRSRCMSSGVAEPVGTQSHELRDLMEIGRLRHIPLCSELYRDEGARLFSILETLVGRDISGPRMVSAALQAIGRLPGNRRYLTPMSLIRHCIRSGSHYTGVWLN